MQAQIIGHSKTIDLVECTVAPQGESIKALTGMNSARWSVPKPPKPPLDAKGMASISGKNSFESQV